MTIFGQMSSQRHRGGAGTVSPQFTTAAPNGVGSITDTKGNVWALTTGTVSSNGKLVAQISVNGVVDPVTGSVYKLIYQGGRIWQFTAFGWYYKVLVADAWTFDPGPGSASGFIVNLGDNTAIIDVAAVVWQLTAGGQIKVDGVIDPVTNNVTQLEYFGAQIWQNTAFGWYRKTVPSDTWVFSATAPGVTGAGTRATILGAQLGNPDNNGLDVQGTFNSFVAAMNEAPTMWTTYAVPDWDHGGVPADIPNLAGGGAQGIHNMNNALSGSQFSIPMVGIPMCQSQGLADSDFASIQAGGWDSIWTNTWNAYINAGFPYLIIRPGWEMNGDWEPWSRQRGQWDANFYASWRATFQHIANHAYAYAAARSGVKIEMCWNPGFMYPGGYADWTQLYPGDAWVDHVGIDTYGVYSAPENGITGAPDDGPLFNSNGDNTYFSVKDAIAFCIAHNKPLCFPEIGGSPGHPVFPQDIQAVVTANPACRVSFVAIWDKTDGNGPNSFWSTDATTSAAWKAMFNAIRSTNGPW